MTPFSYSWFTLQICTIVNARLRPNLGKRSSIKISLTGSSNPGTQATATASQGLQWQEAGALTTLFQLKMLVNVLIHLF